MIATALNRLGNQILSQTNDFVHPYFLPQSAMISVFKSMFSFHCLSERTTETNSCGFWSQGIILNSFAMVVANKTAGPRWLLKCSYLSNASIVTGVVVRIYTSVNEVWNSQKIQYEEKCSRIA